MPYQMRDVEQIVEEVGACGEPYVVFLDNNLGSRRDYLLRLCEALRPLEIIWSAAITIDVTDDPALVRAMALAGCTGVFVGFESLGMENLTAARKRTPRPERLWPTSPDPARLWHPGERQLRFRIRWRRPRGVRQARSAGSRRTGSSALPFIS